MLQLSWFYFVVKQQVLQGQWSTALGETLCARARTATACSSEFCRNFICIYSHVAANKQFIILKEAGVKF